MNAAPVNICDHMCVLSKSGSIMAGDEELKIKRCCCALWMGELCALSCMRETERIRSCFTCGYWVTFPSFVTITYANHNQCTINNSSIKLLLYFLAQTRAPLELGIVSSFVHILHILWSVCCVRHVKCFPRAHVIDFTINGLKSMKNLELWKFFQFYLFLFWILVYSCVLIFAFLEH